MHVCMDFDIHLTIELQYRNNVLFNTGLDQYTLTIELSEKELRYPL